MTTVCRFYVIGWSTRLGAWMPEVIEAKNKTAAKERFRVLKPSLKNIKAYTLANLN